MTTARTTGGETKRRPVADAATAAGVDLSLIECNLRKSVADRMKAHDRALNAALALRKAMTRSHGRTA